MEQDMNINEMTACDNLESIQMTPINWYRIVLQYNIMQCNDNNNTMHYK
jgi:hypothetical protein